MPDSNWKPVEDAPKGVGPVLLRVGTGLADPAFVGHQDPDSGRWFDQENREVQPRFFALIPQFDCDVDGAAE